MALPIALLGAFIPILLLIWRLSQMEKRPMDKSEAYLLVILTIAGTAIAALLVLYPIQTLSDQFRIQLAETTVIVTIALGLGVIVSYKVDTNPPEGTSSPIYGKENGAVEAGIHHFDSQSDLFPFKNIIDYAEESLGLLLWAGGDIINQKPDQIKRALRKGLKVTAILMASNHQDALNAERLFGNADLPTDIQSSLDSLCRMKRDLVEEGGNLHIYTYGTETEMKESVIIVDDEKGSKFAWAQRTPWRLGQDTESRASLSAFERENQTFYRESLEEYNRILGASKPYDCLPPNSVLR